MDQQAMQKTESKHKKEKKNKKEKKSKKEKTESEIFDWQYAVFLEQDVFPVPEAGNVILTSLKYLERGSDD